MNVLYTLEPHDLDLDLSLCPRTYPMPPFPHVWHWYAPQGHLEVYYYNPAIHWRREVDSITHHRPSKALPKLRAWARTTFGPGAVHPRWRG